MIFVLNVNSIWITIARINNIYYNNQKNDNVVGYCHNGIESVMIW